MSRRSVLAGAAGGALSGVVLAGFHRFGGPQAAEAAVRVAGPRVPAPPAPTAFSLYAIAGQTLLIDPNKGNDLWLHLPLAGQGGVPRSVVLPAAGSAAQVRSLYFRHPLSGPGVNPNLAGVQGKLPRWGTLGPGSTDLVQVATHNGRTWSVSGVRSYPSTAPQSRLETVTGAPSASVNPAAVPAPILLWSAADMAALYPDGHQFAAGAAVGTDYSGSGNEFVVNPGGTTTFHKGPLAHTGKIPRGLPGFPYVAGSAARTGMGCAFSGGPVKAWTVLVALSPGDQAGGGRFDEQAVYSVRAPTGDSVLFALKYGNMGYTWDGREWNNLFWNSSPFATTAPVPSVVGWSSGGGEQSAMPSVLAGSLTSPIGRPNSTTGVTIAPPSITGIDLPNSYAICAVAVYAAKLSETQMAGAARRLAYVGYGGVS